MYADSNFISTPSIKEKIDKIPGDEEVQESATLDIQLNGHLKSDNLLRSSVQFSKDLSEDHSIVRKSTAIDEIESADPDLIDDSDTDVKDFEVENVLQKQNTHDLYCPNCKSCITKRVILRKRKRKIRVSGDDVKRSKPEVVVDSKVDASHAQAADNEVRDGADSSLDGTPPLAADDYQPDREPEIFRCLSCFSFFIPAGTDLCITLKVNIKSGYRSHLNAVYDELFHVQWHEYTLLKYLCILSVQSYPLFGNLADPIEAKIGR